MTDLLDTAVATVRRLPRAQRDAIAHQILALVGEVSGPETIPAEDLDDVLAGLAEAHRGEFASEEDVRGAMVW